MPRPRFNKLPEEKRERILEAAAKEFVAHGYEGASLNQILAEAGISKGAAYYYFDDKADVYATAVLHYSQDAAGYDLRSDSGLRPNTFWAESPISIATSLPAMQDRPGSSAWPRPAAPSRPR